MTEIYLYYIYIYAHKSGERKTQIRNEEKEVRQKGITSKQKSDS